MELRGKGRYSDGGRKAAGYRGNAGDCVARAISIAAQLDYQLVYDSLKRLLGTGDSPRDGVAEWAYAIYLRDLDWEWVPYSTRYGSTWRVAIQSAEELPAGHLIVLTSGHMVAVIDGTIYDTYDPARGSGDQARRIEGYWTHPCPTLGRLARKQTNARTEARSAKRRLKYMTRAATVIKNIHLAKEEVGLCL